MNKSKATADLRTNRLLITLVGVVSKADVDRLYTEIRFCVADLQPGFAVINDLSACRFGSLAGLGTFGKIREYLCTREVGPILRVVRKNQLVFSQLSRIIDRNQRYRPIYVTSLDEADAKLTEIASGPVEAMQEPPA